MEVDSKKLSIIILIVPFFFLSFACSKEDSTKSKNIIKLNPTFYESTGIFFIAENLNDCFIELPRMLPCSLVEKMKNGKEEDMVYDYRGLHDWIQNFWLWEGSELKKWFNNRGIEHKPDMTSVIMVSFYRNLNNEPINLENQVEGYKLVRKIIENIRACRYSGGK